MPEPTVSSFELFVLVAISNERRNVSCACRYANTFSLHNSSIM